MSGYFSVANRNYGHWDICNGRGRDFAIRGEPGEVIVRDEREHRRGLPPLSFKSVQAAMAWICDEYMIETKP